jgi:hypothetical protein
VRLLLSGTRREATDPANARWVGLLTSPRTGTAEAFLDKAGAYVAADNDAFKNFDATAYLRFVARARSRPGRYLFITAPDHVGDARATVAAWDWYWPELIGHGHGLDEPLPAAFVLQDGAEDLDLDDIWGTAAAAFVGGSTEWKLSSHAADLMREAKRRGLWLHMGRVNTFKRFRIAYDAGCDSVDGTAFSMFPDVQIPRAIGWLERLHRRPPRGWAGRQIQSTLFI